MIRLDIYLERRAADLRGDAALCRGTDLDRSRRLLSESRELDRRAAAMRRRRTDEENRAIQRGLCRLLDAMDERGSQKDAG